MTGNAGHDDAHKTTGKCEVSGCAEVIAEVWTLLDGECSAESSARLRHHLEHCPGCLQHYGIEEQIKTLVARKCGGDKAPDGLRERLKLQISRTTIVQTTVVDGS